MVDIITKTRPPITERRNGREAKVGVFVSKSNTDIENELVYITDVHNINRSSNDLPKTSKQCILR